MELPLIETSLPFQPVNETLLELLRSFAPGDWERPTIHVSRNVKDLVAHLVDGSMRRLLVRHGAGVYREVHHQQQLRDAVGAPPLYAPELLEPVLETFARGLPFAYRDLVAPDATSLTLRACEQSHLDWTLVRASDTWQFGPPSSTSQLVEVSADQLWRMWTKSSTRDAARAAIRTSAAPELTEPLVGYTAIMA